MTTFFIDLWHDLREKRLWPVAVGLLAAIVAVPAVLFKPASDAAPQAIVAPKTNSAETLPVVAVDSGPTVGSRLEAFKNRKNPFKPMKDLAKTAAPSANAKSSSGGSSSSASTGSASTGVGSTSTGSGSTSTGGASTGGTPSSSTPSPGATPSTPSMQWFHYTADFTFGEPGRPKKFKSAASFTLLPDESKASIMFVGVTDDGKSAVFFISDPAFEPGGEGKCNAKGAACRYVTLKLRDTSDEETFTSVDGSVSYDLKLTAIHREKVDTTKAADTTSPASPKNQTGLDATDTGASLATQTSEGLLPDLLVGGPGVLRVGK